MNAYDVMDLLTKISATTARTEKERLVASAIDDPFFKRVLVYAYDPYITYGITPPQVETEGKIDFTADSTHIWATLDALRNRALTGNAAQQAVLDLLLSLTPNAAAILWRILAKDMRAGFTQNTVNRVAPGTIQTFEVMLAHKYEEKRIKTWPVAVEPKLDGVRVIAVVHDGTAAFFSRSGKPFPAIEHLGPDLIKLVAAARAKYQNPVEGYDDAWRQECWLNTGGDGPLGSLVFEGEMVSGSFNKTVGDIRRKSEAATDASFKIFDVLPHSWFTGETSDTEQDYQSRRRMLEEVLDLTPSVSPLQAVPRYYAYADADVQKAYSDFRNAGFEGAIVKPFEGTYQKKRSYNWLKMKGEETTDTPIIDAFEGTGKYARALGGLVVNCDGVHVRVGGGFTDEQRVSFWEEFRADRAGREPPSLLGRMIEVEYHEKTPDGSLRHPRFVRFRDDKAAPVREAA